MEFTHFNEQGRARMVDVTEKDATCRTAVAAGRVRMNKETLAAVKEGRVKKGDVLAVAQVAGVMAAKRAWENIPMCHPVPLTGVDITFAWEEAAVAIRATARCKAETGVEMEALSAVSAAALTIYDMCKALQRDMEITDVRLLYKAGGKSGEFRREDEAMAEVIAVCISEKKGERKHPVPEIALRREYGIVGDAHAGNWHRQISLLADESVDTMRAQGLTLSAGDFAENILTRGVTLKTLPIGARLRVGKALLEITQIGKQCHNDCAIKKTTGRCVMPTEGVFAVVLEEGVVRPGDAITIEEIQP